MSAQAAEQAAARDERGAVLEAFARALRRETRVLQNRPEILWQQLYNRLRWEEAPVPRVLEPEFEERSKPDSTPLATDQDSLPRVERTAQPSRRPQRRRRRRRKAV